MHCLRARLVLVSFLLSSFLLTLAGPALASDGVREINQACAVQTGCFSGDTPGFPVTIGSPGSYRLTGNLLLPNAFTDGIVPSFATVSNVSIDLNGFEIGGPVVCSGSPLVCSPSSGTGSGIGFYYTSNQGIAVRNGSIRGMGGLGVAVGSHAQVTGLRVSWNRLAGVRADVGSTISANMVYQNGTYGIDTEDASIVSGNTAHANGLSGIDAGIGSTISGNSVYLNGDHGIFATSGSTVSGNTARGNAGDGIHASYGSTVLGNTVRGNAVDGIYASSGSTASGNTAYGNGDDGIEAGIGATVSGNTAYENDGNGIGTGAGATVLGNTVRGNAGFGLSLGWQSGYRENVMTNPAVGGGVGTVENSEGSSFPSVNLGSNACDGSTTCP